MNLNPITREEKFLAKAGGEDVGELKPITRREKFLDRIAGGGGNYFIEVSSKIPLNIEWDGDKNNSLHTIDMGEMGYACKVADFVITDDEFKTCTGVVSVDNGTTETTNLADIWEGATPIGENTMLLAIMIVRNPAQMSEMMGGLVFEEGIYFMATYDDGHFAYPSNLKSDTVKVDGGTAEQLDPKYLPEEVATKEYVNAVLGGIENGTY